MTANKLDPSRIVHNDTLPGARYWSFIIQRGFCLRLTDLNGGANCSALFYNAHDKLERYNMADTLKAQHTACLTRGHVCYSDMGRILMSIIEDTCGWHDTVCGCSNAKLVAEKYGEKSYQEARDDFYRNAREDFLIELAKWGLGTRDMVPNLNFFSKVVADEKGGLRFVQDNSPAGSHSI